MQRTRGAHAGNSHSRCSKLWHSVVLHPQSHVTEISSHTHAVNSSSAPSPTSTDAKPCLLASRKPAAKTIPERTCSGHGRRGRGEGGSGCSEEPHRAAAAAAAPQHPIHAGPLGCELLIFLIYTRYLSVKAPQPLHAEITPRLGTLIPHSCTILDSSQGHYWTAVQQAA